MNTEYVKIIKDHGYKKSSMSGAVVTDGINTKIDVCYTKQTDHVLYKKLLCWISENDEISIYAELYNGAIERIAVNYLVSSESELIFLLTKSSLIMMAEKSYAG